MPCPLMITQAHTRFPTELQAYRARELHEHLLTHPECDFCDRRFVDADALYAHNHQEHFTCSLCQAQERFLHFLTQEDMLDHLR